MTDNPGTHILGSGPRVRFIGQSLRAIAAGEEGAAYLRWASRGGGEFSQEDLEAIRQFLRRSRKPSTDAQPVRRWPSTPWTSKRRETGS